MTYRVPPTPTYNREVKELERIYKKALSRIARQLRNVEPDDLIRQELYESQIRQLTHLLQELNEETFKWVQTTLTEVFITAEAGALVSLGQAKTIEEAKGMVGFSQLSRQRLEAIISDTFEDILQATTHMDKTMKQLIREVQAEVIRVAVAQQRASRDIADELRTELTKKGFSRRLTEENWKGIIDASGRRWDLTTYTSMVARTKIQQTQIEGVRQMVLEHNENDLAIISSHNAEDACRHFENMIISLDGLTKGFPTLAEVRASGLIFHPNCQHTVHAIPDLEMLPDNLLKDAEKARKSGLDAIKRKDEIKKQDNRERYLRNKKKAR